MEYSRQQLEELAFEWAPPLDLEFLAYEATKTANPDPDLGDTIHERRKAYAQRCRDTYQRMTAEGARDFSLSQGITKSWLTLTSRNAVGSEHEFPVMQLDLTENHGREPDYVIIYMHGGGLHVGEADSEELTCRRMLKAGLGNVRLYSVGYRLIESNYSAHALIDARAGVAELRSVAKKKTILVGSSSGGQLAAQLAQEEGMEATRTGITYIHGLMLRGPVTADRHSLDYAVPDRFFDFHTSVDESFLNSMSFYLKRNIPRDGLNRLPLENPDFYFENHPRTWIQISTNDTLYSDGLCYTMALQEFGAEVRLDVIHGWPHTFWLVAPELPRSLKAEDDMLKGLKWLFD
ncbi:hypothetical protein NLU13_4092 [Sarocladium strictum]|uniref:Alpha/beta hydrolase fold-3 domain-containing protein n=1 Tax=Sarocladium strictum TaxID=5046 RepID=A0AA39GI86_SARSR|nr:hypothetical protein NLU13_4092 [Sarocladium strictum]